MIDNPEYEADDTLYLHEDLGVLGLDLWQVKSGTIFDNLLITDDVEAARADAEAVLKRVDQEKKMKEAEEEEERDKLKKEEEENKEGEEGDADEDEEDEEEGEDKEDEAVEPHDEL